MAKEALDLENLIAEGDEGESEAKVVDRGDALEIDDEDAEGKEKDPAAKEGPEGEEDDEGKKKEPAAKEDPEADEDDDGDPKKTKAPTMVPRARLNQALDKQRAAEERITALEAKLREAETGGKNKQLEEFTQKVDNLYEEVEKARAAGEYKDAARLQRELDVLKENAGTAKAEHVAQQASVRTQLAIAYNAVVDQAELLDPRLNPKHEDFDGELVAEIGAVSAGYEQSGKKPAEALKRALKLVLGKDIFASPELRKTPVEPKKTDLKKNIDAAKKTPPKAQEGAPAEKHLAVDVTNLSEEEFDKLPEATKRRMRGDFIE